ncbi:pyocin knob domain-containing protein [Pseudomonas guariconensis]|uniref:pyocin knob domain-containing protein n=1 Tax=Pseudomonas guariconensis TaxID=1288410 RepID=UPI00385069C7
MPWYRTGQVAITAGQTTVTGTGTSFSANGRVGDGFLGPDGRWYEITNIASNTVLSILPAYQGSTVSGGSYAIAPLQGYPKTLADKFNDIANQWGSTLAGLGTVSTENVVPVTKGGTGGTDQASGRQGLGLGTAATGTLTTTTSDGTIGRVLRVGDHGLGSVAAALNAIDIDSLATTGFYRVAVNSGQGPLPINANGYLESFTYASGYARQIYTVVAGGNAGLSWARYLVNSVWGDWYRVWSGKNVVGAVSQSSGVPTGAIIERGSNANGEYTKYADGTMECWLQATVTDQACDTASGALFFGTRSWTYPAAFVGVPAVQMSSRIGTGISWGGLGGAPSNTTATARFLDNVSRAAGVSTVLSFTAKGRWF